MVYLHLVRGAYVLFNRYNWQANYAFGCFATDRVHTRTWLSGSLANLGCRHVGGLIGAALAGWLHRWLLLGGTLATIWVEMWFNFEVITDSAHVICLRSAFQCTGFFQSQTVGNQYVRSRDDIVRGQLGREE
jgi:hypothetical protein